MAKAVATSIAILIAISAFQVCSAQPISMSESIARAVLSHENADGGFGFSHGLSSTYWAVKLLEALGSLGKDPKTAAFVASMYRGEDRFSPRPGSGTLWDTYCAVSILNALHALNLINREELIPYMRAEMSFEYNQYNAYFAVKILGILGYKFEDYERKDILRWVNSTLAKASKNPYYLPTLASLYNVIDVAATAGVLNHVNRSCVRRILERFYNSKGGVFEDSTGASAAANYYGVMVSKLVGFNYSTESIKRVALRALLRARYMVDVYFAALTLKEIGALNDELRLRVVRFVEAHRSPGGGFCSVSDTLSTFFSVYALKRIGKLEGLKAERVASVFRQGVNGSIWCSGGFNRSASDYRSLVVTTALALATLQLLGVSGKIDLSKAEKYVENSLRGNYTPDNMEDLYVLALSLKVAGLLHGWIAARIWQLAKSFSDGAGHYRLWKRGSWGVTPTLYGLWIEGVCRGASGKPRAIGDVEFELTISGPHTSGPFWHSAVLNLGLYLEVAKLYGFKPRGDLVHALASQLLNSTLSALTPIELAGAAEVAQLLVPVTVKPSYPRVYGAGLYLPGSRVTLTLAEYEVGNRGELYVRAGEGTRYLFCGWVVHGHVVSTGPKLSFEASSPLVVRCLWQKQYLVVIHDPLGVVKRQCWVNADTQLVLSAPSRVERGFVEYRLRGWVINGAFYGNTTLRVTVNKRLYVRILWSPAPSPLSMCLALIAIVIATFAALRVFLRKFLRKRGRRRSYFKRKLKAH